MEIKISVDQAGRIGVEGPLQDKIFMFGVLEMAKEVVRTFDPTKREIVTPKGLVS